VAAYASRPCRLDESSFCSGCSDAKQNVSGLFHAVFTTVYSGNFAGKKFAIDPQRIFFPFFQKYFRNGLLAGLEPSPRPSAKKILR